ncbi:MAG: GntR family transcriptional regulator, partial [Lachnospiraceae bacterium]|nr:GntR family transcriptional regulator [Lachnospiraceae bacterium]
MAIKYKWLADQLKTEIRKLSEQGIYKLPTEAFMCKKYHVSRQTVRDAQNLLINEGLIEKVQGSGTFIVDR